MLHAGTSAASSAAVTMRLSRAAAGAVTLPENVAEAAGAVADHQLHGRLPGAHRGDGGGHLRDHVGPRGFRHTLVGDQRTAEFEKDNRTLWVHSAILKDSTTAVSMYSSCSGSTVRGSKSK